MKKLNIRGRTAAVKGSSCTVCSRLPAIRKWTLRLLTPSGAVHGTTPLRLCPVCEPVARSCFAQLTCYGPGSSLDLVEQL
jgi:hypothetical protein